METSGLLRQQITERFNAQRTEKVADAAINLWEQMAAHLILIVGEEGFNSLYARSVFLSQSTFPWLAVSSLSAQTGQRFAELKKCLEAQAPAQAREANSLLLLTFTGILAALIGEELTTGILHSAWNNNASSNNASKRASKEFKNEQKGQHE